MKSIIMTKEQTRRYDDDDMYIMKELRQQAADIREHHESIEIYTADGIVADVIQD